MLVTACHFAPAPVAGTSGDAGAIGDADAAAIDSDGRVLGGCSAEWFAGTVQFGVAKRIAELDDASGFERDPFLTPDGLTIYFSSDRSGSMGGADIYTATRGSTTGTFGPATKFQAADTMNGYEGKFAMTADALMFVVSSNRTGGTGMFDDVWISVRGNTGASWPAPTETHLMNVDDNSYQEDPTLSDDGLHLYLAPNDGVHQKIAFASRTSRAADFTAATVIPQLDSNTGDADPALAFDERLIVFSSSRASTGNATGDLFYATRADKTATFDPPRELTVLNSIANEGDPWLSPDGCHLYYASDTLAGGLTLWHVDVI